MSQDEEVEVGTTLVPAQEVVALDRGDIDIQIATARQYPRSITKSLQEALELATLDEQTAGSMFYSLPRSGKNIEGPSARLAEIMAYSWGNLRAQAEVVDVGRTHVTAVGTCLDLEKNVAVRVTVQRRITDKHGKRYGDDMIGVTSNAATSIALRNCVFKVVPAVYARRIYEAARLASLGKAGTIDQKRTAALDWFGKAGIKPEQVYALLEIGGWDDLGTEELITLRGLVNAIKEGETTLEQVFNPPKATAEASSLDAALEAAARARQAEPQAPAEAAPASEPKKPKREKKAPEKEEDVVTEAYQKAKRRGTALRQAGAISDAPLQELEAAYSAQNLDALISLDVEFGRLAGVHGVPLP